jgi:hypothetical protein
MIDAIRQHTRKVVLVAAVALTIFGMAARANAQEFRGKVALPYEVKWGKAVLPAGNYVLTISEKDAMPVVIVREAKTLRPLAFEMADIQDGATHGESALLTAKRGERYVVHSLRVSELGETFIFDPALARGSAQEDEEAARARSFPVLEAEK